MAQAYFASLPKIAYEMDGRLRLATDLFTVIRRRERLERSGMLVKHTIADGDTPEIVADKIYGHTQWWWVVLLTAGIVKESQWPKSDDQIKRLLERAHGPDYETIRVLVDADGNPAPTRVRRSFTDQDGNVVKWQDHGQGLGVERFGVIRNRGTLLYLSDIETAKNEALRHVELLDPSQLDFFCAEFLAEVASRVQVGVQR